MARVEDVAKLAGVSTATVDRVLNQRPGVRAATRQRVLKAAGELGYVMEGALPASALRPLRLAFLLPAGTNRFLTLLGRQIAGAQDQLTSFNMRARVERTSGELQARAPRPASAPAARDVDGIAFMVLENSLPCARRSTASPSARGRP